MASSDWSPPHNGIDGVQSRNVPRVWDDACRHLLPLIEEGGVTPEWVLGELTAARAQLWCAWMDGEMIAAIVTELPEEWPVCVIAMAGGDNLERWLRPYWWLVRQWAKANGRRCMVIAGRKGWQRLLGLHDGGRTATGKPIMYFPLEAV
jgi:hypothetical protein